MTQELIAELGNLDPQHLEVIARTSVMQYKHNTETTGSNRPATLGYSTRSRGAFGAILGVSASQRSSSN